MLYVKVEMSWIYGEGKKGLRQITGGDIRPGGHGAQDSWRLGVPGGVTA